MMRWQAIIVPTLVIKCALEVFRKTTGNGRRILDIACN